MTNTMKLPFSMRMNMAAVSSAPRLKGLHLLLETLLIQGRGLM